MYRLALITSLASLAASGAVAQTPQPIGAGATRVPAQPSSVVLADGSVVGSSNPLPTRDLGQAPVSGFVAISAPGALVAPGRGVAAVCTGAGQASFQATDGSSMAVPLNVGFNQFGFAVVEVLPGPTAVCTYTNLK